MGYGVWSGGEGTGSSWHDPILRVYTRGFKSNGYASALTPIYSLPIHLYPYPFNVVGSSFLFSLLFKQLLPSAWASPNRPPLTVYLHSSQLVTCRTNSVQISTPPRPRFIIMFAPTFLQPEPELVAQWLNRNLWEPSGHHTADRAKMSRSWFRLWLLSLL